MYRNKDGRGQVCRRIEEGVEVKGHGRARFIDVEMDMDQPTHLNLNQRLYRVDDYPSTQQSILALGPC
jgi:hypothetical protein